ncbi:MULTISPECIES: LxmA leader domain family RiPP [Streptomyces]|uniref:Uncharacterized protein n=1 Tax=Streptomyces cacaoi TaxID=1898 RepID=A0A4Y3QU94_STRCI|nr:MULTISPECIES: LxmA leader domain family RiPP [Streptomyces]NNG85535.1 hypothetical protein [Streptomyces cacaoi]QKI29070.1 cacaoidin precursor peptide [Streptomyces cacaoi]GEB47968.1 hypothetical protein SCA03_05190 [Streptomyces cacaoi]
MGEVVEMVAGFDTYADVEELNQIAVGEAPESSAPCTIYASVSASISATASWGC